VGQFLEEFAVGDVFTTADRVVTRQDISAFADLTGDHNRLHTDSEFMKQSDFGDVIAHGLLLVSIAIGLIADLGIMQETTIALSEINVRFAHPILAGNRIHAEIEITQVRPSATKPDRGVLRRVVRVRRDDGVVALEFDTVNVMKRRAQSA
jgi:acyl dehydratase